MRVRVRAAANADGAVLMVARKGMESFIVVKIET